VVEEVRPDPLLLGRRNLEPGVQGPRVGRALVVEVEEGQRVSRRAGLHTQAVRGRIELRRVYDDSSRVREGPRGALWAIGQREPGGALPFR